ncbi:MAG: YegS/Rv2252/BmrU family lipid kinase, partial [Clostridia bacterium]
LEIYETKEKTLTVETAAENANNCDMLLCMGGDGTLNEVVSGYIKAKSQTPLGYIPTGSTNDFASNYKLSRKPIAALRKILKMNITPADVGFFNGKSFCYVAAAGAFSEVSYATSQKLKNLLGHLAYILEGIKSVSKIKPMKLKIETNEKVYEGSYLVCTVSNSTTIGGIFHFDDDLVSLNDGVFETVLVSEPQKSAEYLALFQELLMGDFAGKYITVINSSEVKITSESPLAWSLDGEYGGEYCSTNIKNLHKKLNLIV